MRCYRRDGSATCDIERWENEGGSLYDPWSESDSHGRAQAGPGNARRSFSETLSGDVVREGSR
jgi:hypothetical protein